ncbi:DUF4064 domain-containing protein [Staphylococcus cohnii]|uniref:DUF4064 domain-containing protein n=1 Tax=Staphylococcus cohnii TaxID=29382 RepID=UPI003D7DE124
MNRKAENILTWIGVGLQTLIAFIFTLIFIFAIFGESVSSTNATDEQNNMLFSTVFFVISVLILIVSIIAGINIKKRTKSSGILLIILGVFSLIGNFISGILWIIAGILLLVRKPKSSFYDNTDINNQATNGSEDPFENDLKKKSSNDNIKEKQNEDESVDPFKY